MASTFLDITYEEDLASDLQLVTQLLENKISNYHMEKRYIKKNKELVWVLLSVSLIRDQQFKPLYFIAQVQNIDERKKMELVLLDKQNLLHSIFNNSGIGIVVTKSNYKVEMANELFSKMLGLNTTKIQSMDFRTIFKKNERSIYEDHVKNLIEQKKPSVSFDYFFNSKSGANFWANITISKNFSNELHDNYLVNIISDITENKKKEILIKQQIYYDSLTGLPNRVSIFENMKYSLDMIKKNNKKFAIFFLDLNNFKEINDTKGHAIGDEVLKTVANRLLESIRKNDIVGRLGGDEFVVIANHIVREKEIKILANRLIEKMNQPIQIANQEFILKCAIGISIAPYDAMQAETLLSYADQAMYKAKKSEVSRICFYNSYNKPFSKKEK